MTMLNLNLHPTRRELRQFAVICLVGFMVAGGMLRWRFSLPTAAMVLWILAPLIATLGLLIPVAIKPVYLALILISYPIGWTISHIVLAFVFYVVITGIGLVFRLIGRDVLGKRFERSATTYWVPREAATDMRRYFRQF